MKLSSIISVFLLAVVATTSNAAESSLKVVDDGDIDYIQEEDVTWTPEEEHRLLQKVEEAERLLQSDKCAVFQKKFTNKMGRILKYRSKVVQGFVCNPVNRNGPMKQIEKKMKQELGDDRRQLKIIAKPCAKALEIALAAKEKKQKILGKKQSMKECRASVEKEVQTANRMRRHLKEIDDFDAMTEEERQLWLSTAFKVVKTAAKVGVSAGRSFGWW